MNKVLSFIEWCKTVEFNRSTINEDITVFYEVLNFYNQKFDVSMLVNPLSTAEKGTY